MAAQTDPNEYIYKALTEHMMERFEQKQTQKALAYKTAIGNLQYYFPDEAIISVKGKRINGRDVPGIGPGIAIRIKEIIENEGVIIEDVPHIEIPTLEPKTKKGKGYTPDILKSGPLLAKIQPSGHDPTGWWMSEKLDGYRAIWDGKEFYSRNGKVFESPQFFKDLLPTNSVLDGELWLGRERFDDMGFVRNKYADAKRWRESGLKYMVYDIPSYDKPFEDRMVALQAVVELSCEEIPECPLQYVKQTKVKNPEQVKVFFDKIVREGGEGVMLRQPASKYVWTRSGTLLKVKPVVDAECTVIGYKEGTNKNKNLLGSFHCEMNGKKFYVGTGITDELRREKYRKTHPIGSLITIQYTEVTKAGIPRFPRYVRKRGHVSGKRHLTIKDFPPRGDEVWKTYDNIFEYMKQQFNASNPPKTAYKNEKVLCDYLKKIMISEVDVPVVVTSSKKRALDTKITKISEMKEKDLIYENKAVKLYKFPGKTWEDLLGPSADKKIQKKFVKILKDNSFDSYYLESPDISTNPPLEFVLVESETLHKKKANWSAYKEYMKKSSNGKGKSRTSTSFDNLSGEFRLIIPLNKKPPLQYGHLADFMRNASSEEIDDILLEVGRQLEKYRKKKGPIYFSTHGDGVPWVHFRIGRVPRYYSYKPYAEKKKTKKKKGDAPTVTCIKVAELRKAPEKYDSLQEWIDADPHHLYIGRNMSFYVPGSYKSKWNNPYPVKKYSLDESLKMYEEHIRSSELFDQLDELEGKVLGCWCLPNTPCHGKVLVKLYEERFT